MVGTRGTSRTGALGGGSPRASACGGPRRQGVPPGEAMVRDRLPLHESFHVRSRRRGVTEAVFEACAHLLGVGIRSVGTTLGRWSSLLAPWCGTPWGRATTQSAPNSQGTFRRVEPVVPSLGRRGGQRARRSRVPRLDGPAPETVAKLPSRRRPLRRRRARPHGAGAVLQAARPLLRRRGSSKPLCRRCLASAPRPRVPNAPGARGPSSGPGVVRLPTAGDRHRDPGSDPGAGARSFYGAYLIAIGFAGGTFLIVFPVTVIVNVPEAGWGK